MESARPGQLGLWRIIGSHIVFAGKHVGPGCRTIESRHGSDVYPAIVWTLVGWTAIHICFGVIMQCYCIARRVCGKLTDRHDADIVNVGLDWHFLAVTFLIAAGVVAGFPVLA